MLLYRYVSVCENVFGRKTYNFMYLFCLNEDPGIIKRPSHEEVFEARNRFINEQKEKEEAERLKG
jgi:hypothetical protein